MGKQETLQVFNNSEFGDIRSVEIDGKAYFVAKDIANALGYKDTTNAIKQHCRGVAKHHLIGSREVAEMVGKDHNKLMRDIRTYIEQLGECNLALSDFFTESTYQTSQNKTMPCYLVTKKGCEFIANKMTRKKVAA